VLFSCARAASGLGLPLLLAEHDSLSTAAKDARPNRRLVVVQVALACALLVGTALLRDGLNHALQTGPGATADRVVVIHAIAPTRYEDPVRGRRFQNQALERVRQIPGVMSAEWTSGLPLVSASRAGYARDEHGPFAPYDTILVSSGYFATMQHGIVEGREFDDRNDTMRADAAVINLHLAHELFADGALGRHLRTEDGKRLEIIGVVSNARYRKMADPVRPTVFRPMSAMYLSGLHLVARTSGDALRLVPAITEVLHSIDSVEIDRQTTLDLHLQTAVRRDRVALVFVAACAVLILLFSVSGPYLLTRHAITSRHDELAVRLALGARVEHVFGLVLSQAVTATASGVLIGEAIALTLGVVFGGVTGRTAVSTAQVALAIAVGLTMLCTIAAALSALKTFRLVLPPRSAE
jgi:hypothetical protein